MDIIVISDIHGDLENLLVYLDKVRGFKFDVIICPGDFTDIDTPRGFTQEDVTRIILKELKTLKKPIFCVPGNVDSRGVIDVLVEEGVSIHGAGKVVKDVGFYGYGGAKTPFQTNIEPSDEELTRGLGAAWEEIKNAKQKIQVTHNPPFETRLDIVQSGGHVGSKPVRFFIEEHNPAVAISSHIHESKGTDKLKNTFLMNSGKFSEGHFGLINTTDGGPANGRVLNLIE